MCYHFPMKDRRRCWGILLDHVTHLVMHGFLHLQGYDHETEDTAAAMEALEIKALKTLNIDNPYEIHD